MSERWLGCELAILLEIWSVFLLVVWLVFVSISLVVL
jgi:hypothetical protein